MRTSILADGLNGGAERNTHETADYKNAAAADVCHYRHIQLRTQTVSIWSNYRD